MCIIFIKFGKETGGNSSLNKFILFWVLRRISISTGQFLTPRSFILGVRISGSSLRPVIMSVLNECRVVLCNHKWNVTQINCTQKIIVIHSILEWNKARFQLLMVCLSMTALHSAFTFFGGKAHLHGVICQHFVPSLFFLSVNSDSSRWWKGTALPQPGGSMNLHRRPAEAWGGSMFQEVVYGRLRGVYAIFQWEWLSQKMSKRNMKILILIACFVTKCKTWGTDPCWE